MDRATADLVTAVVLPFALAALLVIVGIVWQPAFLRRRIDPGGRGFRTAYRLFFLALAILEASGRHWALAVLFLAFSLIGPARRRATPA